MNDDKKTGFLRWLFTPPSEPTSSGDAVAWWERRRIPYNLIVGAVAIVAFIIYCVAITCTGVLQPGEDIIEPLALIAAPIIAPIVINICYTAGWLLDAPLRSFVPSLSPRFTSRLFAAGFAFSLFVVSLPALYWVGYLLLQLLLVRPALRQAGFYTLVLDGVSVSYTRFQQPKPK